MYEWTDEKIDYLRTASERSDYYERLADKLLLTAGQTVCDVGCGLGYLSLAIERRGCAVTAVDENEAALRVLRENSVGVHILQTDAHRMDKSLHFDVMVFCFFGSIEEICEIAAGHCDNAVHIFAKNYTMHRFSANQIPLDREHHEPCQAWLQAHGIAYRTESFSLEMGQPLKDRTDAERFFRLYSRDPDSEQAGKAYLDTRLTVSDDPEFPLYLPQKRDVSHFIIRADDIRKELK